MEKAREGIFPGQVTEKGQAVPGKIIETEANLDSQQGDFNRPVREITY